MQTNIWYKSVAVLFIIAKKKKKKEKKINKPVVYQLDGCRKVVYSYNGILFRHKRE